MLSCCVDQVGCTIFGRSGVPHFLGSGFSVARFFVGPYDIWRLTGLSHPMFDGLSVLSFSVARLKVAAALCEKPFHGVQWLLESERIVARRRIDSCMK